MLSLFRKHKNNSILKLFRAVTSEEARQFDTEYLVEVVLRQLEALSGGLPSDYYITGPYPDKGWKTKKGFLNGLEVKRYQDVCHLLLATDAYSFSFENWSLNELHPNHIDNQAIIFSIREEKADLAKLERFAFNLFSAFPFQYGYSLTLADNYVSLNERKKGKDRLTKEDLAWNESITQIATGLIKNIYPINFIQEQLVNSLPFKEKVINNGLGSITKTDIGLYKWALSDEEIEKAKLSLNGDKEVFAAQGQLV